jgi:hypothetical protein
VEDLEDAQKGIVVQGEDGEKKTIVGGLFLYAGDGQELPKVTSSGNIACRKFCNVCKCTHAGDLDCCIEELRRYQVLSCTSQMKKHLLALSSETNATRVPLCEKWTRRPFR